MKELFFAIWFFLPAGIANVTPIFAAHTPVINNWNYPIDGFKKLHNIRIFGDHKTVRGFVTGIILGTLSSTLLFVLATKTSIFANFFPSWYFSTNPIILGVLLSFGALAGDAVKSFSKRRMNIPPGKTWIPFDQIDYIIGALLMSSIVHILTIPLYLTILIVWVGIHVASTFVGYFLHLKDQPL